MAKTTWTPSGKCPKDVKALKAEMTTLAKKKKGKALIDNKFSRDHLFLGHTKGDVGKIAAALAKLRGKSYSTLMVGDMNAKAQAEVLNWIKNVDDKKLTLKDSTWTISTKDSTVPAANHYDFVTVDLEAFKGMDGDDVVKKSRKWLTSSQSKQPAVACQFDDDGTPVIYHLDY